MSRACWLRMSDEPPPDDIIHDLGWRSDSDWRLVQSPGLEPNYGPSSDQWSCVGRLTWSCLRNLVRVLRWPVTVAAELDPGWGHRPFTLLTMPVTSPHPTRVINGSAWVSFRGWADAGPIGPALNQTWGAPTRPWNTLIKFTLFSPAGLRAHRAPSFWRACVLTV